MVCGEISRETNEKRTISQVITTKFPMQSSREFYCAEQGIWQADQGISDAEAAIVTLVVWEGHPAVPFGNRAFAVLHARTPGTQSTPGKLGNSGTRVGLTSSSLLKNPGFG